MKEGTTLRLVPPALYWGFDHAGPKAFVLLNYMPDGVVKVGDHPAIARRADGSLISNTCQVVALSAGCRAYEHTAKANFHPFGFSYNGEPAEKFAEKDLKVIMADYKGFLAKCFKESEKVLLASRGVHAQEVRSRGYVWRRDCLVEVR